MTTVQVRRATPEDAALLARMGALIQALHVEHEPHVYCPVAETALLSVYETRLASLDVTALVATQHESPLGYALVAQAPQPPSLLLTPRSRLVVEQIAVIPNARRQGVGSLLMQSVETLGRALNVDVLQLDVRNFNDQAIAFYRALGYLPTQMRMERPLS